RLRRGGADGRQGHRHVLRQDRRAGRRAQPLRSPAASLHAGADAVHADARQSGRTPRRDRGPRPAPLRPAPRVPPPNPLPTRPAHPPRTEARGEPGRPDPSSVLLDGNGRLRWQRHRVEVMTMQETLKVVAPTSRAHEEPILRVIDVTRHYRLRSGWMPWRKSPVLQAVDGVSLDV